MLRAMRISFAILALLAALAVSGCSDVRESLGLGRSSPDEFTVVDRPPLSIPPDFALRPPRPGAPRPQEVDPGQQANQALFGASGGGAAAADVSAATGQSGASDIEKELLAKTGGDKASPDIRTVINAEAAEKTEVNEHLVQELLFWKKDEPPGTAVVDARAEAARIKAAKDSGQPLNQGATPIIEREKTGWLGL
jgi:hypothetical protein